MVDFPAPGALRLHVGAQYLVDPEALLPDVAGAPQRECDHAGRYGSGADAVDQNESAGGAVVRVRIEHDRQRHIDLVLERGHWSATAGRACGGTIMSTGVSNAEVALILVDARNGPTSQTYRHTRIAALLGIEESFSDNGGFPCRSQALSDNRGRKTADLEV